MDFKKLSEIKIQHIPEIEKSESGPFEPKEFFSAKEQKEIKDALINSRLTTGLSLEGLDTHRTLFPGSFRKEILDLAASDFLKEIRRKTLPSAWGKLRDYGFLLRLAPEMRNELTINKEERSEMAAHIRFDLGSGAYFEFCRTAVDFFVIFPEYRDDLNLDRKTFDTVLGGIRQASNYNILLTGLAELSLAFPEYKKEIGFDAAEEKKAIEFLETLMRGEYWKFSVPDFAYALYILTHDSRINERGEIEIKPPEKKFKPKEERPPIVRKF